MEQVAAYCDRAAGGRGHRDRPDRAPLPLHPGQGRCSAASGTTSPVPRFGPGMAAYWDHHARVDLDAYVEVVAGGQGRGPARRPRSRGRLLPGPHGRGGRTARRLPLRRAAGLGALARRRGGSTTSSDPVVMAEWDVREVDDVLGRVHRGHGGAGGLGGLRRARPSRTWSRWPGGVPDGARRVLRPDHRGRRRARGWPPRCPRPGGASRWASSTRPRRCSALRGPRRPAHHGVGRPPLARRGRPGRRPAGPPRARPGSTRLQGYRERRSYPVDIAPSPLLDGRRR